MEAGDVIVAVDGEPVETYEEFVVLIRSRLPGDSVTLLVERDEEQVTLDVTLGGAVG